MTIEAMKQAFKTAYGHEPTEDSFLWAGFQEGYAAAIDEQEKCEPVAEVVDAGGVCHFPKLQWKSANHSLETPIGSQLYTHPAPVPAGWQLVPDKVTEEMHIAACKVLVRAYGLDDLPQRMLTAMLAAALKEKS